MKKYIPLILLFLHNSYLSAQQIIPASDEFDRTCNIDNWVDLDTLEGWNATQLETLDINQTAEGQMTLMPYTTAWFADRRSNLIFKEVSGNFVFTTHVSVTNRAGDGIPSNASQYSLAGPLIRAPRDFTDPANRSNNGEDFIFLSCGFASTSHPSCSGCQGPHFEVKSTNNSNSQLEVISIDTAAATIRIVRVDNAVLALYKLSDGDWTIRQRYDRPDLPDVMQVGLCAYTDWNKVSSVSTAFHNAYTLADTITNDPSPGTAFTPDLIGEFDFARFESFEIPSEFEGSDFSSASDVSDLQLLDILGYESEHTGLQGWKIWQGTDGDWENSDNWSGNSVPMISDSILIPNCGCDALSYPTLPIGNNFTYASLIVENGGQLSVPESTTLTFDLSGNNSRFINDGTILNSGQFEVINILGRVVENNGILDCDDISTCLFQE